MSVELTAAGSFVAAAAAAGVATPLAIRAARRTDFHDHPRDYRQHSAPTPFLGGAAVVGAFLLASLLVAGASGRLLVPLGCALAMWVLGTLDDLVAVRPLWRLLAEALAASALVVAGLGWETALPEIFDFVLTVASVVIAVNAFNLMDNLDGACGSVTGIAAGGVGVLAALKGETALAAMAFALAGACAGFLPWNLAGPAKIFLGDGGSMPAGFLVAALAIATARRDSTGSAGVLVAAVLVGLPLFDAALVSFSRIRRRVPIVTGGRDHLSHRLLLSLHSPRAVALALAALQAALCSLAIVGHELGEGVVAWIALGVFLTGVAAIAVLDTARWRPAGIAVVTPGEPAEAPAQPLSLPAAQFEEV